MAKTPNYQDVRNQILVAGTCASLSGIFGIGTLFLEQGVFAFGSLGFAAAGAAVLLLSLRKMRGLQAQQEQRGAEYDREAQALKKLVEDMRPALLFLAEEDAAVVSAVSAERRPIVFPDAEINALVGMRRFADSFSRPLDDSFERLSRLASMEETARLIQETELRFPFVDEILKRVVEHTEAAAMTLIERFSAISEQTGKSEGDAKRAVEALGSGDDSGTGLDALIRKSHASVVGRTSVINDFLRLNRENADRVKKIAELVSRSEELISGIEDITEKSKLIAFNMAVESAKLGDKGLGFKVIVHELQRLNDQTTRFAHDIMDIVKSFRIYNQELLDQWLKKSETLTEQVREDSDQAEIALTALKRAYELSGALFKSLTDSAISVNRSMNDILGSLQFQDITRQELEGAVSFLVDMKASVASLRSRFVDLGCRMGDVKPVLRSIRARHEAQLKVSKDHDMFDLIERSIR